MKTITVVFTVVDSAAASPLYEAHMAGAAIHGLIPKKICTGDQVSIPNEVLDIAHTWEIDCEPHLDDVNEMVNLANQYYREILGPAKPLKDIIRDARGGDAPPMMQGFA